MSISSSSANVPGDDATSNRKPLLMNPACLEIASWPELMDEVVVMFSCFLFGYLAFRIVRSPFCRLKPGPSTRAVSAAPIRSSCCAPPRSEAALADFPDGITAEIARCLQLQEFSALSAASSATWHRFGLSPEAWHLLAADRKLNLVEVKLAGEVLDGVCHGRVLRESFRRSLFHIDGHRLSQLKSFDSSAPKPGGTCFAPVLNEAAHMLQGLMPCDGADAAQLICSAAEQALQAHNPAAIEDTSAANAFLQVMHCRPDIVDPMRVEFLESAHSSALQLQELMDGAVDESFEQMGIPSPPDTSPVVTPPSMSPRLPTVGPADTGILRSDAALEDMHEMQRHSELDALLEKLRIESELND